MNISAKIIDYYYKHKRALVWRSTKDPYLIWISEIMLQQTRVNQASNYFLRFTKRFPNVHELAKADENELLNFWQGLGYYSRARNLHFSAKYIVQELKGVFPDNYKEIIKLKGIGEYTAAAIASIAFNEKIAAIDGNVYRVLARLFNEYLPIDTAEGKKRFKELANYMMINHKSGDFNQAMMEFGATVCKPAKPDCVICPVANQCEAFKTGNILELPVKKKAAKVKDRYFQYLVLIKGKSIFLQKRAENDIWKGLYQFPLLETKNSITPESFIKSKDFYDLVGTGAHIKDISGEIKHRLSHQLLHIRFYKIKLEQFAHDCDYDLIAIGDLSRYPVPKVIEDYIVKEKTLNLNIYLKTGNST
ncbi:MAG: A/G-specific adenine glycosylase [Bacteroidales bacterium]|nr:A/G-specific adenine glycosylase [Bacteroidales bacterium]